MNNELRRRKKKPTTMNAEINNPPNPSVASTDPPDASSVTPIVSPMIVPPDASIASIAPPDVSVASVALPDISTIPSSKHGRKAIKRKHSEKMNIIGVKNEICTVYCDELREHRSLNSENNFPTGRLDQIIKEVKKKRKICKDVAITKNLIRKRVATGKIIALTSSGPESPLVAIEPAIVKMILAMAEIREPLRPSRCINMINDMIEGTPSQEKLIAFKTNAKTSTTFTPIDKMCSAYWQSCRKRYNHLLVNKKGQKFELDCDSWCTYSNI